MNLTNEFDTIRDWANTIGLYKNGDAKTQCLKLQEEVGELASSILKDNIEETRDAIGDCVVVLTNLAELSGLTIEDCVNTAYSVIKNRTGKIVNNTFVKDK